MWNVPSIPKSFLVRERVRGRTGRGEADGEVLRGALKFKSNNLSSLIPQRAVKRSESKFNNQKVWKERRWHQTQSSVSYLPSFIASDGGGVASGAERSSFLNSLRAVFPRVINAPLPSSLAASSFSLLPSFVSLFPSLCLLPSLEVRSFSALLVWSFDSLPFVTVLRLWKKSLNRSLTFVSLASVSLPCWNYKLQKSHAHWESTSKNVKAQKRGS